MFVIQRNLLRTHSDEVPMKTVQRTVLPTEDKSETGRGKIPYVGGYCVAKCRYRLCTNLHKCLYKPGMEPEIDNLSDQISLIDTVIVSATEIKSESKYKDTLKETDRKQNVREGLTNITDDAFEFF
ncbi:hypothetical protein DPMN_094651 [Dreissena polymorpha]|uniref:Uncharacterized protein n=1 Tax=Dreissena polymorpha TaxID=45954 RepID=A0A9D4R315_DREPO|nr:hypothetical protein DPMN_094651 [Dreissena polymorpha]